MSARRSRTVAAESQPQSCATETENRKVSQRANSRRRELPRVPDAPTSIRKGSSLKEILGPEAIDQLARNLRLVHRRFDAEGFGRAARAGLDPLGLMQRGPHIARALRPFLPERFEAAVSVLRESLAPPLARTEGNGLAVFFHHPHASFVAEYGLDPGNNGGDDPFEAAMETLHAITRRFTAEFAVRPFLLRHPERTLDRLAAWTSDPDPHVRRLCSEGTRPRLPWAPRIPAFVADPMPNLPILDALRDDPSLYVRRSVANHVGDIAKDHPQLALSLCERWLVDASAEVRWVVRHALRHPAKKGDAAALRLRAAAGPSR